MAIAMFSSTFSHNSLLSFLSFPMESEYESAPPHKSVNWPASYMNFLRHPSIQHEAIRDNKVMHMLISTTGGDSSHLVRGYPIGI